MKEIIINVPDEFTEAQTAFIRASAMAQIEAEMKATLKVPQADIDAVEVKIAALKSVNVAPKEEPKEEIL